MRLTPRCLEILKLLSAARWLRTRQLHRRFFAQATANAAQRRLRALSAADYLRRVQPNRMEDALFALGPEGKRALERQGLCDISLHRHPPKQLEHFLGVNDIRMAAELSLELAYFFGYWELAGAGWKHAIIPDAVFGAGSKSVAVEFDRGHENIRYFLQKLKLYERGLRDFPLHRILIVTDRRRRMETLAKALGPMGRKMLLTTLDSIQQHTLAEPIFFENSHSGAGKLL